MLFFLFCFCFVFLLPVGSYSTGLKRENQETHRAQYFFTFELAKIVIILKIRADVCPVPERPLGKYSKGALIGEMEQFRAIREQYVRCNIAPLLAGAILHLCQYCIVPVGVQYCTYPGGVLVRRVELLGQYSTFW